MKHQLFHPFRIAGRELGHARAAHGQAREPERLINTDMIEQVDQRAIIEVDIVFGTRTIRPTASKMVEPQRPKTSSGQRLNILLIDEMLKKLSVFQFCPTPLNLYNKWITFLDHEIIHSKLLISYECFDNTHQHRNLCATAA